MRAEPSGQLLVDPPDLFPVDGGGVAVVVAAAEQGAAAGSVGPQHFRIAVCQPFGPSAGGRGQDHVDPPVPDPADNVFQPLHLETALFRLQGGPGEDAQGDGVDAGFFKIFQIFFQNFRSVQPLLRVVVAAVQQKRRGKGMVHKGPPFRKQKLLYV